MAKYGSTGLARACLILSLLCVPAARAVDHPNVVILLADDLGWADVGYHGGEIATPAIDRLAREGLRLERFYSAPICSPTRAALLSGRDPMKLGIGYDQINPWNVNGFPPDAYLLSDAFRAAGYQTGLVGKWHLGHTQAHQLPNAHGFDTFYGHLHTQTDFYTHERAGGHDLQRDGVSVSEPGVYLTHIEAREAVRFIRERDPSRPFFLYVPFTAPHSPMQAPEATVEKYHGLPERGFRRVYAAMVDEMDRAIAAILETLDAEGLTRDTIVLFFSDNGGFNGFGADNRPLRGQKGETFEGGIRVPAVLRWPARLPAGETRNQIVSAMDVMPTLASAAGVALQPPIPLDGRERWGALRENTPAPREEPLFFVSEIPLPGTLHLTAIDPPWKLVQILREEPTRIDVQQLLFRIDEDPNEERDLAQQEPRVVARLAEAIAAWRSQHPMAGTRVTLVPPPGWVPPLDWAAAVVPETLLQPRWENELPFPKALLDATARRGVLVDPATREKLIEAERRRAAEWQAE
jgi:arylsulfatase B